MLNRPNPVFRTIETVSLIGTMAVYENQAEASEGIPRQWRAFLQTHSAVKDSATLYGASPCTGDRRIHYLTGTIDDGRGVVANGQRLTLEAGEYAVVRVDDGALLR